MERGETSAPEARKETRQDLLLVVAAALLCLFVNLGEGSLKNYDEARYAEIAREMVRSGRLHTLEWNYTFYHKKPPLVIWATSLSYLLFGVDEFGARFVSAASGLGTAILTYVLGRALASRRAALLGALVLCSMPMFLKYSRLGMLDATLAFFVAAGILAYWRSRTDPRRIPWIGFAFAGALLTKSAAGLVLPGVIVVHALAAREFSVLGKARFWLSMAAGSVIGASWWILQYGLFGADVFTKLHYHIVQRSLESIEGHGAGIVYYAAKLGLENGVWGPLALLGAGWILLRAIRSRRDPAPLLVAAWIVVVFGLFTAVRSKIVWYIVPALPGTALAVGVLLDRLWARRLAPVLLFLFAVTFFVQAAMCTRASELDFSPGIKRLASRTADIVSSEDTIFLFAAEGNHWLFYSGTKVRRADDEARWKLFTESVRARGRRYCLVRESAFIDFGLSLPAFLDFFPLEADGEWILVEVRAR